MEVNRVFTPTLQTNVAWDYFYEKIDNPFGTAALVGGLYFVSGCDPDFGCKQIGKVEGKEDTRKNFIFNKKQFGIGGWRHWIRKQSLWNYSGKSAGMLTNLDIQVYFVMDEFSGTTYGTTLYSLKHAEDIKEAVSFVLNGYLDLTKKQKEESSILTTIAEEVYSVYAAPKACIKNPVKYIKTDEAGVTIWKDIPHGLFKLFATRIGKMDVGEMYAFVESSEDGKWFRIRYDDQFGYVDADKTYIVIRME